ncbi:MAG: D-alanine--D-alanine ligase [Bacteroidales bacterium]|jgi:D-alanine-D-alanine ligase|nr:D-alanine--D-alanine ligase [Bacteroidales bacterium]
MKTIAIVAGGDSSEYQISVKSGNSVAGIISSLYRVYLIIIRDTNWYWEDPKGRYHSVDKNNFTLIVDDRTIRFDAVFIAIHGKPGENGMLQGYFDMLQIPYTGCNAFCSALTFNKHACKLFLKEYKIAMAESILVRKDEQIDNDFIINRLGLPCFVKPNDSGSSFGVSKVSKAGELAGAVSEAFRESDEILIESFMQGRELACGLVKTDTRKIIFPVTEIISKNEFFDFEAKYTPGKSDEITPADLPEKQTDEIRNLGSRIADLLGCRGIVRVDFIITGNKPLFLEINTVPGMTEESIIPKQAAAAGIPLKDLYSMVIEDLFV